MTLGLTTRTDWQYAIYLYPVVASMDANADFFHSLSFATSGDVFNLPAGYTVNSVSGGIVNNRFVGAPVPLPSTLLLLGSGFPRLAPQAAAWRFVEFLSTRDSQAAWYRVSRSLPARRDAWDDPALARQGRPPSGDNSPTRPRPRSSRSGRPWPRSSTRVSRRSCTVRSRWRPASRRWPPPSTGSCRRSAPARAALIASS